MISFIFIALLFGGVQKVAISYQYDNNMIFRGHMHANCVGENDLNESVFFPISDVTSIKSMAIEKSNYELSNLTGSNNLPIEGSVLKSNGDIESVEIIGFIPWESEYELHMFVVPLSNKKSEFIVKGSVCESYIIWDEEDENKLKLKNSHFKIEPELKDGSWVINVDSNLSYDKFEKDNGTKKSIIGEIDTQYVRVYFEDTRAVPHPEQMFPDSVFWK